MDAYFEEIVSALERLDCSALGEIIALMQQAESIYILGNGGSQANASHLVLHLSEKGFKAHDLMAEIAYLTALANDFSYQHAPLFILRRQAREKDILLVISGSGDSMNVLAALAEAKRLGMGTIGFLGMGGGAALGLCQVAILVPSESYGTIEDCHSALAHLLAKGLTKGRR